MLEDHIGGCFERQIEIAGNVAEQVGEYAEKAQTAAKQFKSSMEKNIKEQPLAMLAAVSLIGFLLGALWKK